MTQPRSKTGTRQDGVAVGGRWTAKDVPDIDVDTLGFNDVSVVGPPHDWDTINVEYSDLPTVFTRTVTTDDAGNEVVTVTTNCDPPDMTLLARKGDFDYWATDNWHNHVNDRQIWSADITARMLEEGLVATGYEQEHEGVAVAMHAATIPGASTATVPGMYESWVHGPHVLTADIAQIRGMR